MGAWTRAWTRIWTGAAMRAVAMAVTIAVGVAAGGAARAEAVRLASGAQGGVYQPVGAAIKLLLERTGHSGIDLTVLNTAGSVENLRLLRDRRVDFAIAQADQLIDAFYGRGAFAADGPFPELRAVAALHKEQMVLLVPARSPVHRAAELAGRKVGVGLSGNGTRAMIDTLMAGSGRTLDLVELPPAQQAETLCAGGIDALATLGGNPNSLVLDALTHCPMRIVPLDGPVVRRAAATLPYAAIEPLPSRLYPGIGPQIQTLGTRAILVTRADVSDAVVTALLDAVAGHLDLFRQLHPALDGLTLRRMRLDAGAVPLHRAAALYFEKH